MSAISRLLSLAIARRAAADERVDVLRSRAAISRTSAAILSALLAALALGCGDPRADSDASTIRIADTRDPGSLDPALMWDAYDSAVAGYLHEGLVRFGTGTDIVPGLAHSWEIAPDALSATFHLRDARYHDGSPVRAWDVKYCVTRLLDSEVGSQRRWLFEPYLVGHDTVAPGAARRYAAAMLDALRDKPPTALPADSPEGVAGVEIIDARTVRFRFNRPYLPFLTMLAMPNAALIPLGAADMLLPAGRRFGVEPIGAGPWHLESWAIAERMNFRAFDGYWAGAPAADRLVFRVIGDTAPWRIEFEVGNIDIYRLTASDIKPWRALAGERRERLVEVPELNLYFLAFNVEKPHLADARVRRALGLGLNVDEILTYVAQGQGVRAHGTVPPPIAGHQPDLAPTPFDPDAARALLAEAGVGAAVGGASLAITLYHAIDRYDTELAQAVRADWERLGVDVTLKGLDRAAFADARRRGECDVYFGNWWADYPDIDNFLYPLFHSSNAGGSNRTRYRSAEVDALLDEARYCPDPARRLALYGEAERRIIADAPMIFLWHRSSTQAVQPWLRNYSPHPMINGVSFREVAVRREDSR